MTLEEELIGQYLAEQLHGEWIISRAEEALRNLDRPELVLYPVVADRAVPERKRRSAASVLDWLARSYERPRPALFWFTDASATDTARIEARDYAGVLARKSAIGLCVKTEHRIGVHVERDGAELVSTLSHEFAHSAGADEETAQMFGRVTMQKLCPRGGLAFGLGKESTLSSYTLRDVARPGDSLIQDHELFVRHGDQWREHSIIQL